MNSNKPKIPPPIINQKSSFQRFLSQALRLWAIKDIIPSNEFIDYHISFINIDKNFGGVISKDELLEYFGEENNADLIMKIAD